MEKAPATAAGRGQRFFGFSEADPWTWIPGHWVRPGVIFITHEQRFYEIIKKADGGWDCEEVPAGRVGPGDVTLRALAKLAEIDKATAALSELLTRADSEPQQEDVREFVRQREIARRELCDELVRLCNPEKALGLGREHDTDQLLLRFVPFLGGGFVVALVSCVVRLYAIEPEHTTGWILTATGVLAAWCAICTGIWLLWRYRRRLPLAQITGWIALGGLIFVLVAVAAFFIMFMGGLRNLGGASMTVQ